MKNLLPFYRFFCYFTSKSLVSRFGQWIILSIRFTVVNINVKRRISKRWNFFHLEHSWFTSTLIFYIFLTNFVDFFCQRLSKCLLQWIDVIWQSSITEWFYISIFCACGPHLCWITVKMRMFFRLLGISWNWTKNTNFNFFQLDHKRCSVGMWHTISKRPINSHRRTVANASNCHVYACLLLISVFRLAKLTIFIFRKYTICYIFFSTSSSYLIERVFFLRDLTGCNFPQENNTIEIQGMAWCA